MENPVKEARIRLGKTMEEFANEIGCHFQAVFLCEKGTYPHILPVIAEYILTHLPTSYVELESKYLMYQKERREHYGRLYDLAGYELAAPSVEPPVVDFRRAIGIRQGHPDGLSRMAFCKEFCVHSAELYGLERGEKANLSEQFKIAMRQAGLPDTVLSELEFRCEEFASGNGVLPGAG